MQEITLGRSSLKTSRLAYGTWRIAGSWDPAAVTAKARNTGVQTLIAAYESGFTLFDLADIYCGGVSEEIMGQTLRRVSGMRARVVLSTKCGIRAANDSEKGAPYRYDFSAAHIIDACEHSLGRLGVEHVDLFQLHRPDYLMDPQEVARAFAALESSGKVRHFGVSNFRPSQVTLLQSALKAPLLVNQVEISLAKLDCLEDGTLDQCLTEGMTPMAWSPLGGGHLGEGVRKVLPSQENYRIGGVKRQLDILAREMGTSRWLVALAWLLKHPAGIVPIIGTTRTDRIHELAAVEDIQLMREQWYQLLTSARRQDLP